MGAAEYNAKIQEAIDAQEAGDIATALAKMRAARMMLAGMPNSSTPDVSLQWDRASLDSMIADLVRQKSGSAGIRRQKVRYVRPGN